ncbi:DEAD/DEAH box helicase [Trebonia sp.]|uniref:DEAD/DEAH box helicase n=1 Tax=Trebonia sp. TaxID=2767075 RepID=UPI002606B71B|nr:DEAD/DEAH box helicase [Trebonia sp.]
MPAEKSAVLAREVTFASLGVPAPLVSVLDADGITVPFPIQAAALPDALAGRDILGRAKTGSGKTLGFALPMAARLAGGETTAHRPRGLVLVPTRELATQVQAVLTPLAHVMGLRVGTVYGGVSYRPQITALQRRTDVLVACPGRLADLIGQGHCDLGDVEMTVIDEADQMADLGFLPIVRRMLEATPSGGQRLLFSATLDTAIDVLARRFLTDPAQHSVDEITPPAEIEHHVITIDPAHRLEVVAALAGGDKRSLVFTRTKHGAQRLARHLTAVGIPAAELHGNLAQGARSRNLAAFGTGAVRVMVATDIAARGIHVAGIDLVIHADPPAEHKAYVHRSGRTARGGADGVVVTMQTAAQAREVRNLMRQAGVTPHQAAAEPDSDVLREIAGPPVPKVTLVTPVTDLIKPARRLSGQPGAGRADAGKPRRRGPRAADRAGADQPRSSRRRRADADRPAEAAGAERPVREDRPAQSDRGRQDRFDRFDRPDRRERSGRPEGFREGERSGRRDGFSDRERTRRDERAWGDRPVQFDRPARLDRPARFDRPSQLGRPARFDRADRDGGRERDRERGDWRPYEQSYDRRGEQSYDRPHDQRGERATGGRASRGQGRPASQGGSQGGAQDASRPGWQGGSRGGSTGRSGYSGSRTAPGKRRNPGQGRHF